MSSHRLPARLALLSSLVVGTLFAAAPANSADPAPDDQQVVSTKATARPTAASVNFRKDLGLHFASLGTLGSRVDAARRAPDPVALAHAAGELSVAESVSGKKASVTSQQLIKEAAELAALRRQAAELRAVQQVSTQIAAEESVVSTLKTNIGLADAQTKADQEAFKRNEEPTAASRQIVVNNYTPQTLDIWINGMPTATVQPGSNKVITLEHRWNPTTLTAYGDDDSSTWGPRYIWGKFTKYTWNIN